MSENRRCTKAMAAVESRFCNVARGSSVTITQSEFQAISHYIETLEHQKAMLAAEAHSYLSQLVQPEDYQ